MKNIFTKFKKQMAIAAVVLFSNLMQAQVTPSFTYTLGAAGTVSFTNLSSSTATTMCCELWSIFESFTPTQLGGTNLVHTFSANGNYLVRLVATDNLNNSDSTTQIIAITNAPCVASATLGFWSPSPTNWNALIWGLGNIVAASWNWGDSSPNSTGLTPSHTYSAAGVYNVCLSFTNSCGASTTVCQSQFFSRTEAMQNVTVYSTNPAQPSLVTGINTLYKDSPIDLIVFPNPAQSEFTISGEVEGKFEIINQLGQKVYEFEIKNEKDKKVSISGLENGIYYLKSEKGSEVKKVVVAK